MMISTKKDAINYSLKLACAVYFLVVIYGSKSFERLRESKNFCNTLSIVRNIKSKVSD